MKKTSTNNKKIIQGLLCLILILGMTAGVSTAVLGKSDPARVENITPEQAIQHAQRFMGKELIDIKYVKTFDNPTSRLYYLSSEKTDFFVNANTGIVEGVQYSSRVPHTSETNFTLEEAKVKAFDFAKKQYTNFENMTLTEQRLVDHGETNEYLFVWSQFINSVLTPNIVYISVNPSSGEIITYVSSSREITPFDLPKILADESKRIAVKDFGSNHEISVSKPTLAISFSISGEQLLIWKVQIDEIVDSKEYQHGALYSIDANTSKIIEKSSY